MALFAMVVRLLNRTTRSLSLTEAGQLYHEKCVEMLIAAEMAEEIVAGGMGEIAGRLRVSAASNTAQKIVLPALAPLARQHLKLLLDIVVDDRQCGDAAGFCGTGFWCCPVTELCCAARAGKR